MSRLRGLLGNLAAATISLAVVCAGLELAARFLVSRAAAAAPQESGRAISRYSERLGWDKPPGGSMRIARDEYDVTVALNSKGLRGPETAYEKPPGTKRVLILGDSFGEGYYVEEPASARAVLEKALAASSCPRYEVVNGSTAGYSTDQEYLFFVDEGARYQPDLVVVFFYYNDLYFNTTGIGTGGKPKPYFEEKDGALVLRNVPVPREAEGTRARVGGVKPWHGSVALRLLSNRTVDGNPRLHAFLARLGLVEPVSREPFKEFWPYSAGHREETDEMWRRTALILKALKAAVEQGGGRLAVLYVPSRLEVNEEALRLTDERYRMGLARSRDRVINRLRATCNTLGIPVVDPREPLRAKENAGVRAYFPRDGHWNEIGNQIAAEALLPFVRQALPCP